MCRSRVGSHPILTGSFGRRLACNAGRRLRFRIVEEGSHWPAPGAGGLAGKHRPVRSRRGIGAKLNLGGRLSGLSRLRKLQPCAWDCRWRSPSADRPTEAPPHAPRRSCGPALQHMQRLGIGLRRSANERAPRAGVWGIGGSARGGQRPRGGSCAFFPRISGNVAPRFALNVKRRELVRRIVWARKHSADSRFVHTEKFGALLQRAEALALVPIFEHGASLHTSRVASSDNALTASTTALAK